MVNSLLLASGEILMSTVARCIFMEERAQLLFSTKYQLGLWLNIEFIEKTIIVTLLLTYKHSNI